MANRLGMATVQTILQLKEHGWSNRQIERELGIRRETVSRYVRLDRQAKAASAPPGLPETERERSPAAEAKPAGAPPGLASP